MSTLTTKDISSEYVEAPKRTLEEKELATTIKPTRLVEREEGEVEVEVMLIPEEFKQEIEMTKQEKFFAKIEDGIVVGRAPECFGDYSVEVDSSLERGDEVLIEDGKAMLSPRKQLEERLIAIKYDIEQVDLFHMTRDDIDEKRIEASEIVEKLRTL